MNFIQSSTFEAPERALAQQSFIRGTYGWMAAGLGLTGLIAFLTASSPVFMPMVGQLMWPLIIAELALVLVLSFAINRIAPAVALIMFLAYAAMNGVTLSAIFMVYTSASIASTFVITAGMFGAMAIFGSVTKRDLTSLGSFMFMGLIGLVLASFVNFFMHSPMIYWITTYFGVFIFVGLTAYDAQKIKELAYAPLSRENSQRASIIGALRLYLDFLNLFLYLLRIFGGGRQRN